MFWRIEYLLLVYWARAALMSAQMARAAKCRGARFTISTDAHHPNSLQGIHYGVTTARRAWLGPADILNTLPLDQFTAAIARS